MKNKQNSRSYITIKQRVVGTITALFLLMQIVVPGFAAAAYIISDDAITKSLTNTFFQKAAPAQSYLYQKADFAVATNLQHQNISTFHKRLVDAKLSLPAPVYVPIAGDITVFVPTYPVGKLVGDEYVQNRMIRQQIYDLLGRHMIDPEAYASEVDQINALYSNAYVYAQKTNKVYGVKLTSTEVDALTADMIWPETRLINGEFVVVPVLHLTAATIAKQSINDHRIEFFGSVNTFGSTTINNTSLMLGRSSMLQVVGNLTLKNGASIKSEGNIAIRVGGSANVLGSVIQADSSLDLRVGGVFSLVAGQVSAKNNIDIYAGQVSLKPQVHLFTDRYGKGTRLGQISSINAAGDIAIRSTNDIQLEASTITSTGGAITLAANGNINILPAATQYQSQYTEGHWQVDQSSLDIIGSKITADDTIKLIAGGAIGISASELVSTQGGIELLASQGIYIVDELSKEQIQKIDRKGKTTGQSSEFRTEAVRAALVAGKGVILDTQLGDITLQAANISSVDGATVNAENGKVNLLMTKELEEFHLQTVKKGFWTIKTRTEDVVNESNIQNAIIGGVNFQAKYGVSVEYTGKENATLKEQLEEYAKNPETAWMAEVYNQCWIDKAEGAIDQSEINYQGQLPTDVDCNGPKVSWSAIEEIHKELRKSKSSLSPAAMAIIAIAVAVAMGPAGANLIGAGGLGSATVTTTTVAGVTTVSTTVSLAGAVLQAGMLTLATQAAQSLAAGNNLSETISSFDSDENLKSLAISMATAGALNYAKVGDYKLFEIPKDSAYSFAEFGNQAVNAVASAVVDAGISVTISGGNSDAYREAFRQGLMSNAVNTIGQAMTSKIGQLASGSQPKIGEALKYISLAGSGCLIGLASATSETKSTSCYSGAGGAVIGEYIGEEYSEAKQQQQRDLIEQYLTEKGFVDPSGFYGLDMKAYGELIANLPKLSSYELKQMRAAGVDLAKLSAALVGFAVGGDVNISAGSAERASNYVAFYDFDVAMAAATSINQYLKIEKIEALVEKLEAVNGDADKIEQLVLAFVADGDFTFLSGLDFDDVLDGLSNYTRIYGNSSVLAERLDSITYIHGRVKLSSGTVQTGEKLVEQVDSLRAELKYIKENGATLDPGIYVESEELFELAQSSNFDPMDPRFIDGVNRLISYARPEVKNTLGFAWGALLGVGQFIVNTSSDTNAAGEYFGLMTACSLDYFLYGVTLDPIFKDGADSFNSGMNKMLEMANNFPSYLSNLKGVPADIVNKYKESFSNAEELRKREKYIESGKEYFVALLEVTTVIYGGVTVVKSLTKQITSKSLDQNILSDFADELDAPRQNWDRVEGEFYGIDEEIIPSHIFTTRVQLYDFIDSNIPLKDGWDFIRLYDEVLSKPKGERPLPETYLPAEYIELHSEQFKDGASRIVIKEKYDEYGPTQKDGTTFVSPRGEIDKILSDANGDPVKLAKLLGFDDDYFVGKELVRIDIPSPEQVNARIPQGSEGGANSYWLPGGKLPGGNYEAVVDLNEEDIGSIWFLNSVSGFE